MAKNGKKKIKVKFISKDKNTDKKLSFDSYRKTLKKFQN